MCVWGGGGYMFPCSPEIFFNFLLFSKIKILIFYVPCPLKYLCSPVPVFKPEISVLGPRGPYPPKSWGHLKKSGDSTINDQNFIENVPVAFRCG